MGGSALAGVPVYGAATLRKRSERAADVPLPYHTPGPKDAKTCPGQPPTREAEHLTPGFRTRQASGTFFPQTKQHQPPGKAALRHRSAQGTRSVKPAVHDWPGFGPPGAAPATS
jgi:hypothetical protein